MPRPPLRPPPGPLLEPEEAVPAPADGGQPGARADDGRRRGCRPEGLPPTVEVHGRRTGIQTAFSPVVFPEIHQHIHERVPHRARGGEWAGVIAILPHGAAPAEGAVDRPCYADGEAAKAPAERPRIVRLDDEMHMIVLHAELEDSEAAVGGRGEGTADGREDPLGSQATDRRTRAQGDVQGVRGGVRRPAPVRRPPQVRGAGRESCPRAILIGAMVPC